MNASCIFIGGIFYEITVPVIFIIWLWTEVLRLNFSGVVYPDSEAYRDSVEKYLSIHLLSKL
jgi:hypothetical protein